MNKKQYLGFIALLVFVGAVAFYWFQYRPSQIKKECASGAILRAKEEYTQNIEVGTDSRWKTISEGEKPLQGYYDMDFNTSFVRCLKENGL